MQLIDIWPKGNLIRLVFTNQYDEAYGDDWDDAPFECNKGYVYDEYIDATLDIVIPFSEEPILLENIENNMSWKYVKKQKLPVMAIIPQEKTVYSLYEFIMNVSGLTIHLGDDMATVKRNIAKFNLKHIHKIKII